ncbi:Gp15 family bacteriophage protein, partial [Streptococcus sobrinus]|uniref:Gp15 family bacteriophage protein n=1 Tax=Streptococcus sobrinus TaxID=1310 RepID=UPI00036CCC81
NKSIKPEIALNMLVVEKLALSQLNGKQKAQLIIDILKDKLNIDLQGDANQKEQEEEKEPVIPVVDFTADAERIYSSFLFDYNID